MGGRFPGSFWILFSLWKGIELQWINFTSVRKCLNASFFKSRSLDSFSDSLEVEVRVDFVHVERVCLEPSIMEHSGDIRLEDVRRFEDHRIDRFKLAEVKDVRFNSSVEACL